jgi:hypothetical protein
MDQLFEIIPMKGGHVSPNEPMEQFKSRLRKRRKAAPNVPSPIGSPCIETAEAVVGSPQLAVRWSLPAKTRDEVDHRKL